ncbi:unnamed protein product [Miscanthus lutarioriparius]|uniref:Transposase-associated domain-containing protein n=1 Tax=Miscanthus lutarioriparius TaxID=422564 RepID=A0A811RJQ2_9POAL|nr:unnamed protein product [Miscanthus lutarioriparius]
MAGTTQCDTGWREACSGTGAGGCGQPGTDMLNGQKSSMWCPCVDCKNEKQYSNSLTVHAHLIMRGFMDDYRCWNKHGEEGVNAPDQAQAAG